jgi:hypothetical protein
LFLEKGTTEMTTEILPRTSHILESPQTVVSALTNEDIDGDGINDNDDDDVVDVDFNDVYVVYANDNDANNQQDISEKTPKNR